MERTNWTERMTYEENLQGVKDDRNILNIIDNIPQ